MPDDLNRTTPDPPVAGEQPWKEQLRGTVIHETLLSIDAPVEKENVLNANETEFR